MDCVCGLSRSELRESCRPIGFEFYMGDPLNMRNQDISLAVEEADAIHGVWELDLSEEPLVRVPNSDHAALIRGDYQVDKFVGVAPCHCAVMLLLLFVLEVVDFFLISVELIHL